MIVRLTTLALMAGVAACSEVKPNAPALAPTAAGTAAPVAQRAATGIAGTNSINSSSGVGTIVGTDQSGRPIISYSGQAAGSAGSGVAQSPITSNPNVRRGSTN